MKTPAYQRICLVIIILFSHVCPALASLAPKFSPEKIKELKKRRAPLTSKKAFRKLQRIYSLMDKKEYGKAETMILKLLKKSNRPFQKAQNFQTLAHLYIRQDKLGQAISFFNQALSLNTLPLGHTLSTMYSVVQILASQGKNLQAKKKLEDWFQYVEKPQPQAFVLYASLLFEQGDKKGALVNINHALKLTKDPKESWLRMAVVLNYEAKDYATVEKLLRRLVEINPNKRKYWQQLSSTQLILNHSSKSLASLELAYKQRLLKKERHLLSLINLYSHEQIPLKTAQLLEEHIQSGKLKKNKKNYRLLAQAWLQAEEPKKAIAPLKKAAQYAKDGEIDIQLGQLYMQSENWTQALKFFQQGVQKGKLKSEAQTHLMMGITFSKTGNKSLALKYLKLATESEDESTETGARQWLKHIQKK